MPLQAACILWN